MTRFRIALPNQTFMDAKVQLSHDTPEIGAPTQIIYQESLSSVNLEDRAFFDHAQYLDAKAAEKNLSSKYFQKEAQYISNMVFISLSYPIRAV